MQPGVRLRLASLTFL